MDTDLEMNREDSVIESRVEKIGNWLRAEFRAVTGQYNDDPSSGSIPKVPSSFLQGHIAPKLVSIGPYHRVTPCLNEIHERTPSSEKIKDGTSCLKEMEDVKKKYLLDLTHRSPKVNYPETYVKIIEESARRAKNEFSHLCQQLDHEDFVKIMVVDGCFIVEFLLKWFFNDRKSQVSSIMTKLTVLKNDLLLVENQIPYFVLEELFQASDIPGLNKSVVSFTEIALTFLMGDRTDAQSTAERFIKDGVRFDHFLHLYHKTLTSHSSRCLHASLTVGWFFIFPFVLVYYLLTKIMRALFILAIWIICKLFSNSRRPRWIPLEVPNARDLRDSGFKFRKKNVNMDYNFMDVSRHGTKIKIPVLIMNESTRTTFQNLIAFETCSSKYGNDFTAYAMLLDRLIDSAEDVAILKACGIIDNRLGDDQKVADFFNNLGSGIDLGQKEHYLSPLFKYVSNYYRDRYYMVKFYWWRKKYVPDYFSNPWAIPSMIAASMLLAMAFLQTYYTVFPYYNPRSNG